MDGEAGIKTGSMDAWAATGAMQPQANAASGRPRSGRNHLAYQAELRKERGLFGGLYAVRGDFLRRMHERNIRLPEDLIGDDGLIGALAATDLRGDAYRSEEHTSELQSLMRISYAVFCLKKKKNNSHNKRQELHTS